MKQPHTEDTIEHTDGQQNTGNHKQPGAPDAKGADIAGGTRAGAQNVEKVDSDSHAESVESGTDLDKVSSLDGSSPSTKPVTNTRERHPERDENGRM